MWLNLFNTYGWLLIPYGLFCLSYTYYNADRRDVSDLDLDDHGLAIFYAALMTIFFPISIAFLITKFFQFILQKVK